MKLPVEMRCIIACLQTHLDHSEIEKRLTSPQFSWEHFTYLIQQHRVIHPIHHVLNTLTKKAIDEESIQHIAGLAKAQSMRQLLLSGELVQISRLFGTNNICLLALKGIAQSLLINDKAYTRHPGNDIDVWIPEEALSNAFQLLNTLGYERTTHGHELSEKQWKHFKRTSYDEHFFHPTKSVHIELHWRLDSLSEGICNPNFEEAWERRQYVVLAGEKISTLGFMDNLYYLSYHAAKHGWHRLFWLMDIVKILQGTSPQQWSDISSSIPLSTCQRPVLQAINMANTLFDTPLPNELHKPATQWSVQHAVNSAYSLMSYGCERSPRIYKNFITRWITLPSWMFKWRLLQQPFIDRRDWKLIKLPDSLFFLYYLIRPFTWILRKLGLLAYG